MKSYAAGARTARAEIVRERVPSGASSWRQQSRRRPRAMRMEQIIRLRVPSS